MTKNDFSLLLEQALARALASFSTVCGETIDPPTNFEVHSPSCSPCMLSLQDAVNAIFIDPLRFYRIIDIGLIPNGDGSSIGFIRVSGHRPGPYEETFNPKDLGPFKILEPLLRQDAALNH